MDNGTCIHSDGCERATFSRRFCRVHYMRVHKAGELDRYPKVVRDASALRAVRRCVACGESFTAQPAMTTRYCSRECSARSQFSPLRLAHEAGDRPAFIAEVRAGSQVTDGGCWQWQGRTDRRGYPAVAWSGRVIALHRLVLEAKVGALLGSQHSHHVCANTGCVNPQHLQPVTNASNAAEMSARRSYVARIEELESALRALSPRHPLLDRIPLTA